MDRCIEHQLGGIASLAQIIEVNGQALNYDLLTRIGVSLYTLPRPDLDWADLRDFVEHLDAGSALVSEMEPDVAGWQGDSKVPMLLAHIADLLAGLSYGYTISHMKKGARKPDPPQQIPRPGVESKQAKKQHWGSDAIPISDFNAWWDTIYEEDKHA